jgi:hypothetical protein
VIAKIEELLRDGPSSWTRERLTELFGELIGGCFRVMTGYDASLRSLAGYRRGMWDGLGAAAKWLFLTPHSLGLIERSRITRSRLLLYAT